MDPLVGFLPPNVNPPEGDGSVFFDVMPKEHLATGTTIANYASIVFDLNTPIVTPIWLNAIDNSPPASQISRLPSIQAAPTFRVDWIGNDVGAGVRDYSIFVAEEGGEFFPWLENTAQTSAVFTGLPGRLYSFYSTARDWVGNVEAKAAIVEASTRVDSGGNCRALLEDLRLRTEVVLITGRNGEKDRLGLVGKIDEAGQKADENKLAEAVQKLRDYQQKLSELLAAGHINTSASGGVTGQELHSAASALISCILPVN